MSAESLYLPGGRGDAEGAVSLSEPLVVSFNKCPQISMDSVLAIKGMDAGICAGGIGTQYSTTNVF